MTTAPAESDRSLGTRLSPADLERARQIAAEAPALTQSQRDSLRAILAGCMTAPMRRLRAVQPEPDRGGDDVAA
jgi:hypothetical protein